VSEVQFSETAAGASVLQGTFYSDTGRPATSLRPGTGGALGGRRFMQSDSRECTISQARNRIQALAYAVQMSEHHIDLAHRWYILALQHQFTRGRKSQNIAAACLYIVCRQEKTSHMLLDFSDILQTNVFVLGHLYLRLCRLLNLEMPLIDPSLYIGRFASRLEFGDKTTTIASTALRLVSRMQRDWIQTGRRPAGICGACLLISARLYGFVRTYKEVIDVVRVCELTLKRRLQEFSQTPSAQLTPEQFHGVWLEQEIDPPAFTANVKKAAKQKEEQDKAQKEEVSLQQKQSEELEKKAFQQHYLPPDIVAMEDIFDMQKADLAVSLAAESLGMIPGAVSEVPVDDADQSLEAMDNDLDITTAFLDDDEIAFKTKIWMEANRDFLIAQEEKLRLKKEMEEKGINVKAPRKKRKPNSATVGVSAPSGESGPHPLQSTPQTKKISKKFNYEALDSLLQDTHVASLADFIDRSVR
jgi:transcription factor IIIB 90 kDa subunit